MAAKDKTPRKKRWVCPQCNNGNLGSRRPRKDNVIRYCLPCSAKGGFLVERVCPADVAAKERKVAAKKGRVEQRVEQRKATPRPRKTKRSWMRDPKFTLGSQKKDHPAGLSYNIWEVAERMCKSKRWGSVVASVGKSQGVRVNNTTRGFMESYIGRWFAKSADTQGKWDFGLRIAIGSRSYSAGRAAYGYGVTLTTSPKSPGQTVVVLLHELTHFVQTKFSTIPVVNGKRRPHDLFFNTIQYRMAKIFFGYDTTPRKAGWSMGRGYAPTEHLKDWLDAQISAGNPKVMKWFTIEAPAENAPEVKKERPPNWEITQLEDGMVRVRFTPSLLNLCDYIMDSPEDDDRIELGAAIGNATQIGKGYGSLVDMRESLLDLLSSDVMSARSFESVMGQAAELKGSERAIYAIKQWKQGKLWSVRGASYSANRWFGPEWSGGVEEPRERPSVAPMVQTVNEGGER